MKKGWFIAGAITGVVAVAGVVAAVVAKKKGYNLKDLCKCTTDDECECGCCECCCEVENVPEVPEVKEEAETTDDVATEETAEVVEETKPEDENKETETVSE